MSNTNLRPGNKFWAELEVQSDGKLKVKIAKKYKIVNQYVRGWKTTNARNFARALRNSKLVTR